ncbi:group 1 truncated hemoglobin [Ramlibacter sp. AW1]|uniref:Group 1 truncated hemoglobin n=1 Tax=Ramlibacter aurantiacus TaxID=2801330 RepID=A0A937D0W9_9BURK|nr:group 1 truncated hemoglobin [Ramlibacter aurantiacus]MBL0419899.1 group 1 truncated hemoglobin [Ramlibacter aurantiacus]
MTPVETKSLYQRLGGFDGITRIVHDVMDAHLSNPLVAPRFQASEDLDHAKQMAVEFFCAGCGGPEAYTGRDLLVAHKGMNISEQEYMAAMDDILGALRKNDIDDATRGEVTAILYSLKGQIIRV